MFAATPNAGRDMMRGARRSEGQTVPITASKAITAVIANNARAHEYEDASKTKPTMPGIAATGSIQRHTLWLNSFQAKTPKRIGSKRAR